ncbi:MAG: N-6 DNA methylase, partial [Chloroflexota bacterium]|nr:N-6 DNA methylase [Chloroflexota bacterium]
QLPLPTAQLHQNQQLFSDYYLNVILPGRPDWRLMAADARPVMDRIAAIFAAYTPSSNEAQTERDLVRPVLEALGHTFEVQAALTTPDGTRKPDYVFYRDQTALVANKGRVLTDALLKPAAFAVGDAKYWDRPLDVAIKGVGGDPFTNKNPSYQIAFYMQHSGVEWGILTNGRLWRLYHRDTAHKLDRFYEVDLQSLIETGDAEAFLYFYGFFHRSAFEPHALGVAKLLQASVEYARGVGDTLKAQVYEALRHLAQGFLDYAPNRLEPDEVTLKAIYDNSLIVLYRLLIILNAEPRRLLPNRESERYPERYSLQAIKGAVADDLDMNMRLLPTSATLWPRLRALFEIIDAGSPPLKVATFNGGLFDPRRHPFLQQYTAGDSHLQQAIDKLARVNRQFVDYRDLDVRHLGTIYEGLLEYHLQSIPREGEWTVALLNDRGERKATGSYYTPDYIVKYIVDQTVGPVLAQAVAGLGDDAARITAVLRLDVLDPAMGSGHFLVEATEYIARFLVDLAVAPDADARGEADLQYWKRRVAQNCVYGVDLNPLAVELAKLSLWLSTVAKDRPLSFLDHHLRTGNALVGARIADLHVGGGSGTEKKRRAQARQAAAGQLSMLDDEGFRQSMSSAVDSMWLIEGTAGNTVEEVKEQERIYAELRETLTRKYGRLADLATATHFGVEVDAALWQPLADFATRRTIAAPAKFTEWLEQADALAEARHFFHWELEFPEVFFDRHGQPLGEQAGFDAVIGNPPYVRQEELAPLKPYFAAAYPEIYHGVADLYVYFFGQGLRQL